MNFKKRSRKTTKVEIYSKSDCHLCEVAKATIAKAGKLYPLEIVDIDISTDPDLFSTYREQIPVVFIDGRKLFKYRVDEDKLRAILNRLQ